MNSFKSDPLKSGIAIFFLLWAVFLLCIGVTGFFALWEQLERTDALGLNSIPYFFKNFHLLLLNIILASATGIGLLRSKKVGLTAGLLSVVINLLPMFVTLFIKDHDYELTRGVVVAISCFFLAFITAGILLIWNQRRSLQSLDWEDYAIMGIITGLIVLGIIYRS